MSEDWQKTICILCSVNCGVDVKIEGRHITRVRGNRDHVASNGYACEKAQRIDYYQNGRDRLDLAAATAPRRQLRGNRLGYRDRRGRRRPQARARRLRRREHLLLWRRRTGKPSVRQLQHLDAARARFRVQLQRARPGKDRRVLGRKASSPAGRQLSSMRRSRYSSARIHGSRTASSARVRCCAKSRPTRIARSS